MTSLLDNRIMTLGFLTRLVGQLAYIIICC